MTIVSQAEYSRLRGVSKKTITQWKQEGKLVLAEGGIDVEASDAHLQKYRKAGLKGNAVGNAEGNALPELPAIKKGESTEAAVQRIMLASGADMTIEEARRVKENYLALTAQLDYDRESGLVVEASVVAAEVGAEYAKVRTRLLSIPAEHAPRVHRLKTVTEVQDALQELITDALEELTKDGDS
jgi:phage terminase Nu1 subunit (DNA packaging protein)